MHVCVCEREIKKKREREREAERERKKKNLNIVRETKRQIRVRERLKEVENVFQIVSRNRPALPNSTNVITLLKYNYFIII